MMQTGTMKGFNDAKGLGCIAPDGGREDLFAYLFEDRGSGYKSPQIKPKSEPRREAGPEGRKSRNIQPL